MINFQEAFQSILDSSEYKEFATQHSDYYLAHGFTQLDKDGNQQKNWQIGFYSKENDNLAVFETNPIKLLPFEEAFKDGGTISQLKNPESFLSTGEALDIVHARMKEEHSHEMPTSYLVILQVIDNNPVYNITVITAAFAMITMHIHAESKERIHEKKQSILDLKKGE